MMDPRRIHLICELLYAYWELNPCKTLGQLIHDIFPTEFNQVFTYTQSDVTTEEKLRELLMEKKK